VGGYFFKRNWAKRNERLITDFVDDMMGAGMDTSELYRVAMSYKAKLGPFATPRILNEYLKAVFRAPDLSSSFVEAMDLVVNQLLKVKDQELVDAIAEIARDVRREGGREGGRDGGMGRGVVSHFVCLVCLISPHTHVLPPSLPPSRWPKDKNTWACPSSSSPSNAFSLPPSPKRNWNPSVVPSARPSPATWKTTCSSSPRTLTPSVRPSLLPSLPPSLLPSCPRQGPPRQCRRPHVRAGQGCYTLGTSLFSLPLSLPLSLRRALGKALPGNVEDHMFELAKDAYSLGTFLPFVPPSLPASFAFLIFPFLIFASLFYQNVFPHHPSLPPSLPPSFTQHRGRITFHPRREPCPPS